VRRSTRPLQRYPGEWCAQRQPDCRKVLNDIAWIDPGQLRGSTVSQSVDPLKTCVRVECSSVICSCSTGDEKIHTFTPFQGKQDETLGVQTSNILQQRIRILTRQGSTLFDEQLFVVRDKRHAVWRPRNDLRSSSMYHFHSKEDATSSGMIEPFDSPVR
jgi:hypothetical protein